MNDRLSFETLTEEKIPTLAPIMKRAFDEDSRIHLGEDDGGPPGYDDGSFLRENGLKPNVTAFQISLDGTPVGGIILLLDHSASRGYLGNIFLDPSCENKGLGTQTWNWVESQYPDITVWEVDTPAFSRRNHNFYVNKCGFHVVRIDNPKDTREAMYFLRKEIKPRDTH